MVSDTSKSDFIVIPIVGITTVRVMIKFEINSKKLKKILLQDKKTWMIESNLGNRY